MFTAAIAGSDTTTGLTLSYNGQNISVKVEKDGSLLDFCAQKIATNDYKYLQAYTTLELIYDGVQFIITGNPVVLSGSGYVLYANGRGKFYKNNVAITFSSSNYLGYIMPADFNLNSFTNCTIAIYPKERGYPIIASTENVGTSIRVSALSTSVANGYVQYYAGTAYYNIWIEKF
jgi:hypothetical protein